MSTRERGHEPWVSSGDDVDVDVAEGRAEGRAEGYH